MKSYKVKILKIESYEIAAGTRHRVRWRVDGCQAPRWMTMAASLTVTMMDSGILRLSKFGDRHGGVRIVALSSGCGIQGSAARFRAGGSAARRVDQPG